MLAGHSTIYRVGSISYLGVPLTVKGGLVGAMTFSAPPHRSYSQPDIVDDLLDLGRIRSGTLQFEFEQVDLMEVVRDAVTRLRPELARSGSSLSIVTEGEVVGYWDRFRLEQVASNLLSNAVKFGLGKPIQVFVHPRDGEARLVVTDHGMGIPPDLRERIFNPFERGVSVRHYGGLGLGLHIVRTIVSALGGSVTVESEAGSGSTFTVELPLARHS